MLKTILSNKGYEVAGEASNGQEAVDLYGKCNPDLVLMDITMPVLDGIGATRQIKQAHPNCNIMMCTAMGNKESVVASLQAGAKGFVVKPFQPDRVIENVQKMIGEP